MATGAISNAKRKQILRVLFISLLLDLVILDHASLAEVCLLLIDD
jgi:MFS family permease